MSAMLLPSTRGEAWRWSDLSALPGLASSPRHPGEGRDPRADTVLKVGAGAAVDPGLRRDDEGIGFGGPTLLFVDGEYRADDSNPGPIEIGAVEIDAHDHPLASQAAAIGWRIRLTREHAAPGTIHIVHRATGGANHLAAEIVLDEDAQASIVESFTGEGWANRASSIRLGRSARLMLARRVLSGSGFTSLIDRAEIAQGASLTSSALAAGGGDTRIELHATLTGEGAFAEAGGALLARGKQRHDAAMVLRHAAPGGSSRQVWRSVADDRATASVAARVEVARDAQATDAVQSLKGMLLARTATVNFKPELEIFADDVKCAHGATVGQLDQAAMFYLASRGVPPPEAKALLTRAFVGDALARIGDEAVREVFEADAEDWLSNHQSAFPSEGSAERCRSIEGRSSEGPATTAERVSTSLDKAGSLE